jgi:hypothetical protein
MRFTPIKALALAFALTGLAPAPAPDKKQESLADQVGKAIERGVKFLKEQERGKGNWEIDVDAKLRRGGWTALALLALLNAGESVDDPVIKRGLEYLRTVPPTQTYTVGLQTAVFAKAGLEQDRKQIQRNVDWLLATRLPDGWTYAKLDSGRGGVADNSNTQYALLGLHAAMRAGAKVDRKALEDMHDFYRKMQTANGAWVYRRGTSPSLTMTAAGISGLVITSEGLQLTRSKAGGDGKTEKSGERLDNKEISKAITWMSTAIPKGRQRGESLEAFRRRIWDQLQHPFYCLYGVERAGRLTGERLFGENDWYRMGCEYLLAIQKADGSWGGDGSRIQFDHWPTVVAKSDASRVQFDHWPIVATSFALLFLAEGRMPALVTKLAHGDGDDWNNVPSDVPNLVAFANRHLFKGQLLASAKLDVRAQPLPTIKEMVARAEELRESPLVFLGGRRLSVTLKEEVILKHYLETGGFLFTAVSDERKDFDADFRALMKRMFPDDALKEVPADHPIWTASGQLAAQKGKPFTLYGIEQNGRLVLVYCPQALAGYWEANQSEKDRGKAAFELGANVIAHATRLKAPPPRLSNVEVPKDKEP